MNTYLFNLIHSFADRHWSLDMIGVFFAEYLPYLVAAFLIVFLFKYKSSKDKLAFFSFIILSLAISGVILAALRFAYFNPRPFVSLNFTPLIDVESSGSFPSAHTIFYFTLASSALFFNRKTSYWLFASAFLIGLGRIFVGVHWPLDVLVGAVLGFASAYATAAMLNRDFQKGIVSEAPSFNKV